MKALQLLAAEIRSRLHVFIAAENTKVLAIAHLLPPEPFYSRVDAPRLPGIEHPGNARQRRG